MDKNKTALIQKAVGIIMKPWRLGNFGDLLRLR